VWARPRLLRASHADKRRAVLGEEIRPVLRAGVTGSEIQAVADRLPSLADCMTFIMSRKVQISGKHFADLTDPSGARTAPQ
jgi:hypothetical protein